MESDGSCEGKTGNREAYNEPRSYHAAVCGTNHILFEDLRVPPGNKLELLSGDRAGQHSIRINDQWRICFVWSDGAAENVEIVDYH